MSKILTTSFYSTYLEQQKRDSNAIKLIEYFNQRKNIAPTNIEEYARLINLIKEMIRDVKNINLKYQDVNGNTIFHHKFIFKAPSLLENLIKADPQAALIKNSMGKSPLDAAQEYQLSSKRNINEAINLLKECEHPINSTTPEVLNVYNVPTVRANNSNSGKLKANELENKDEPSISSITPNIPDTYNVLTVRANNSNSRKLKANELENKDESSISSITPNIPDTYNVLTVRANNSNSRKRKASELENKDENKNSNSKRYKTNNQGSMDLDNDNSANKDISTNNSTNIAKEKTPNDSTNFSFNIISSPLITQNSKDAEIAKLGKELIEIIDQKIIHKTTGKVAKIIGDTIKLKLDAFLKYTKNDFKDDKASFLKILNYQDINGNTALHIAVFKNYITIGEKLVKLGANPAIQNKEGNTAAHLGAEWGKNTKLLKITREQCKDIKNNEGNTVEEIEDTEYQKWVEAGLKTTEKKDYLINRYEERFPKKNNNDENANSKFCHLVLAEMPKPEIDLSNKNLYNHPEEKNNEELSESDLLCIDHPVTTINSENLEVCPKLSGETSEY